MGHLGFKGREEHHKRYRARQKEKGLCTQCSRKAVKGLTICKYHRNYKKNKMKWKLGDKHKYYGKVVAMGIREGEPYRFFMDDDKCISLIPLPCLEVEE